MQDLLKSEVVCKIGTCLLIAKYTTPVEPVISHEEMFPQQVIDFEKICAEREVMNDAQRSQQKQAWLERKKNSGTGA